MSAVRMCGVGWCSVPLPENSERHTGAHEHYIVTLHPFDMETGRRACLSVLLQGHTTRARAVAIQLESAADGMAGEGQVTTVTLTWPQLAHLASALANAERSYRAGSVTVLDDD